MLLLLAVLLPVTLYMLLSVADVQERIRTVAQSELSRALGADISIGDVSIRPFRTLSAGDVSLSIGTDTIAYISTVSAGFELFHFLRTGELVIDYALLDGASVRIWRKEPQAPLNIAPLIAHLKSDTPKEPTRFELKINTVILRHGSLSYHVQSAPAPAENRFDPSHISVSDLSLNAFIPTLSNERYRAHIDHLSFAERSGFTLRAMRFKASIGPDGASIDGFEARLPHTHIALAPLAIEFDGYDNVAAALRSRFLAIATRGESTVTPADFSAFIPALSAFDSPLALGIDATASTDSVSIATLTARTTDSDVLSLAVRSLCAGRLSDKEKAHASLDRCRIAVDGPALAPAVRNLSPDAWRILARTGRIDISVQGQGSITSGRFCADAAIADGSLALDCRYSRCGSTYTADADALLSRIDAGVIAGHKELGTVTASVKASYTATKHPDAALEAKISELTYKGYSYSNIALNAELVKGERLEADIAADDPNAKLLAYAYYNHADGLNNLRMTALANGVDFHALGLSDKKPGYRFAAKANIDASARSIDDITGSAKVFDIRWLDSRGEGLKVNNISLTADPLGPKPSLTLNSDVARGVIKGPYTLSTLVPQLHSLAALFIPALVGDEETHTPAAESGTNDFDFELTLLPSQSVTAFFGAPVHVITDINIRGEVDSPRKRANINIDAPYLVQGTRLLEQTSLYAALDSADTEARLYAATTFPTKKGDMTLTSRLGIADNRIDTRIDWGIARAIPLSGTIDFSTLLRAIPARGTATFPLDARIDFNPGTINFGYETWQIAPSTIDIAPQRIDVSDFSLDAGTQRIDINGTVGDSRDDRIDVALDRIALIDIFETLEIHKVLIGGRATGRVVAKNLLGGEPEIVCPALHVDTIGYQYCTIGNADVAASWDNAAKAVVLDADITGTEGRYSHIFGSIYPLGEGGLDLNFEADSIPVGFLRPFLSAFSSDISGRASGKCRLFGPFSSVDLEGDVKATDVALKVDFTGVTYTANDSVHMRPGSIFLDKVRMRDPEGHTAVLDGRVTHTFFKDPMSYRFDVTRASNLLVLNTTARDNPDWHGRIYANGKASIAGKTGEVNISADMTTAPGSTFDFVLSDRLDAEEYSFINFRDATPDSLRVTEIEIDDTPQAVKSFRNRAQQLAGAASKYNMDIRVAVTPEAAVTLVMDPSAGDCIRAHGNGSLHMAYRSANDDLNIWGKYSLTNGQYRFTLQDIIIKDFIIKEGSEIQFDGDPYSVKTNLKAYYATNGNLTDLDESFADDKDVARTNVPVHALMNVTGDIRQPSITFDLEFPTLTSDTYRKVRSIVSTEDMMNRQIIYLLTLNRFYTPDYMASTTKGNELFSVASSTLAGQLGNMLGKLSDSWSIAPNLRSDRGDFSDVEVDVALSSRLLNNRLIFNGNFGYRDKTLNSNQFIGDFDIEYLLNKKGSWRLKAYNRYNDRNYYLRTAQTTQGVGIMYRHEFDNMLKWVKWLRPRKEEETRK